MDEDGVKTASRWRIFENNGKVTEYLPVNDSDFALYRLFHGFPRFYQIENVTLAIAARRAREF